MVRRILNNGAPDASTVRALVLPTVPALYAVQLLPDATILSDIIAGRAEFRAINAVGPDWTAISEGLAPPKYASGDVVFAQMLLYDITVRYTCVELVPLLRQLVPNAEKSEVASMALDLNWGAMEASFEQKAAEDVGFLLGSLPVPLALQMASPLASPVDPDAQFVYQPKPLFITG